MELLGLGSCHPRKGIRQLQNFPIWPLFCSILLQNDTSCPLLLMTLCRALCACVISAPDLCLGLCPYCSTGLLQPHLASSMYCSLQLRTFSTGVLSDLPWDHWLWNCQVLQWPGEITPIAVRITKFCCLKFVQTSLFLWNLHFYFY